MLRTFTDQLQRPVTLPFPPRRIVSLVPSQTELLYDLGLRAEVVGITKFCVHPAEWFRTKTRVGGTKQLHLDAIAALQPDLIIANKEENERTQIESLAAQFPVWLSDIHTLEEALYMIRQLGELVDRATVAEALTQRIQTDFSKLDQPTEPIPVAYFIWRKPYLVAAADTFIHAMLQRAGFQNVFAEQSRYPEVTLETLALAQPAAILLSSEPYPFQPLHQQEFQQVCPLAVVQFVDGELFSWYGSRLVQSVPYFHQLQQRIVAQLKSMP